MSSRSSASDCRFWACARAERALKSWRALVSCPGCHVRIVSRFTRRPPRVRKGSSLHEPTQACRSRGRRPRGVPVRTRRHRRRDSGTRSGTPLRGASRYARQTLRGPTTAHVITHAPTANTASTLEVAGINLIERMTSHTFGLGPVASRDRVSSKCVLSTSHEFHVSRVATCSIPAEMVYRQPIRDFTVRQGPGDTMGKQGLPVPDESIPSLVSPHRPRPTDVRFSSSQPNPESHFERQGAHSNTKRIASLPPSLVVELAKPTPAAVVAFAPAHATRTHTASLNSLFTTLTTPPSVSICLRTFHMRFSRPLISASQASVSPLSLRVSVSTA